MEYETSQERLWAGSFGTAYIGRSTDPVIAPRTLRLWSGMLRRADVITSALELGANVGRNLRALRTLYPDARLIAVEINAEAAATLQAWGECEVHVGSLTEYSPMETVDLAFTCGVLIHVQPSKLAAAYDVLYRASRRYVLVAEYYNPTPVSVPYRGQDEALWKRDFAGELLERYPDLRLVDYGFAYRNDPQLRQDDITWFLLEKR